MLNLFQASILGVVEGLTEFLPISSTAHLILATAILKIPQSSFVKSFEIIIQSGAILAVLVLYWRSFLKLEIIKRLIVAFIPTAIVGLTLYQIVKDQLLGNVNVVLWALALGGILLIAFEKFFKAEASDVRSEQISYVQCLAIGLCQSVALVPGVSRSGATIVGGMIAGLPRQTIVEFSFLLAVPTMFAASLLDVIKEPPLFTTEQVGLLLVGIAVSFITAWLSIRWLLSYVQKNNFIPFGIYRIILVLVFLAFLG